MTSPSIPSSPILSVQPSVNQELNELERGEHPVVVRDERRIDFSRFVQPIFQVFSQLAVRMREMQIRVMAHVTDRLLTIRELFCQLIYPPPFNPRDSDFIELIRSFGEQQRPLQRRLDLLNHKFRGYASFSRDLNYLNDLHKDIHDTFMQLEEFTAVTQRRVPPLPIHEEMMRLKTDYSLLQGRLNTYLHANAPHIFNIFCYICNLFIQPHAPMPSSIRNDLYQYWTIVRTLVIRHVPSAKIPVDLYQQMFKLREACLRGDDELCVLDPDQPLYLKNIGNSCYLDSALQALFACEETQNRLSSDVLEASIEQLRQELRDLETQDPLNPLLETKRRELAEKERTLGTKKEIQMELLKLIQGENAGMPSVTYTEYILSLLHGPSALRIRQLMFNSQFNSIEFPMTGLRGQHDAAAAVELFMSNILEYKGTFQRVCRTAEAPGRLFYGAVDSFYTLQIPLVNRVRRLSDLIRHTFAVETLKDAETPRVFVPAEGVVVDEAAAATVQIEDLQAEIRAPESETWVRIKSLPDVLALHVKRFAGNAVARTKNDADVEFPEDGVVDLTDYLEDNSTKARYEMTGFLVHHGASLHGGHYVAYVKRGETYWFCDDMANPPFRKITREEFFRQKKAYVVILKRIEEPESQPLMVEENANA